MLKVGYSAIQRDRNGETITTFDVKRWLKVEFGAFKGSKKALQLIEYGFAR